MRSVGLVADGRRLVEARDAAIWVLAGCFLFGALRAAIHGGKHDFTPVWSAATAVLNGDPPYKTVTAGGDYVHTPGSTLLSLPFAIVPENVGGALLVIVSVIAFAAGLLIAAAATDTAPRIAAVTMLACAMSAPVANELHLANVDALCVLPLGLALYMLTHDRPALAGALIGLAMTIKPTVAVFLLLPLALGAPKGTLWALGVAAILNLIALPVIPEASRFFTSVVPFLLGGDTDGFNVSLKAAMERAGTPELLILIARIASVSALMAVYLRYRTQLRQHPATLIAFLTLGTVFVTSYFFDAYLVYLALAVGALALFTRPVEWVAVALGAYLLLSHDTLRSYRPWLDATLGFRYVIGAALLLGAILVVLERQRRQSLRLDRIYAQ